MKEQKAIKNELLKNLLFNLILFIIVFSAFSMFIWLQVFSYLYDSSDKELYQFKKQLEDFEKYNTTVNIPEFLEDRNVETDDKLTEEFQISIERINNPRIVTILRNHDGKVLATSSKVKAFAEYLEESKIDKSNDEIYEISINSKYYYRGITCKLTSPENEDYYVDILVNINSEKAMISNFTKALIIGTIAVIIISFFISIYLSRKSINPIVKAYKKQTEFVQNASHELRTPLTIIQAKQEMLLQSPDSTIIDKSEDIALTLNETRRLSKMVSELMDLARADNDKTIIDKSKTDLNDLIREVMAPFEEIAEMQNKTMESELSCNKEIYADKNKLKQLLVILLDNAVKYTEKGDSIKVIANNQNDKFTINVIDTGIGISDESLKHVFERFYREDKARSREKGGSGLGLAIAHTIVSVHGGTIKINHNKPKGTIVTIKF